MKFENYFKNYNKSIFDLLNVFDTSLIDISVSLINNCKNNGGKVYIVGNGGSSSIASHVSVDFAKIADVPSDTFNNSNLITCFANDYGHENWISEAIKTYSQTNDMLILISSSGNSPNVLNAADYSKKLGLKVVTFSGFSIDNKLKNLGDINIWVDCKAYNIVEMTHHIMILSIVDFIVGDIYYSAN